MHCLSLKVSRVLSHLMKLFKLHNLPFFLSHTTPRFFFCYVWWPSLSLISPLSLRLSFRLCPYHACISPLCCLPYSWMVVCFPFSSTTSPIFLPFSVSFHLCLLNFTRSRTLQHSFCAYMLCSLPSSRFTSHGRGHCWDSYIKCILQIGLGDSPAHSTRYDYCFWGAWLMLGCAFWLSGAGDCLVLPL